MSTYFEEYQRKLITAEQAAKLVQSNSIIEYGMFTTKPVDFDVALSNRVGDGLERVAVRSAGSVLPVPQIVQKDPEQKTFQYYSWYYTALDRKLGDYGLVSYLPHNFHDGYYLSSQPMYRELHADIWVAQVTPMDKHGCFNFGPGNIINRSICMNSKQLAIVEVNENMPCCFGGCDEYVHISEIDYIIEGSNTSVFSIPGPPDPTLEDIRIAQYVMEEITDGSCLQLGIGAMPNLIGQMIAESDLKDLGIQSEMFCDAFVNIIEAGKVTNARKAYDKNKSSFAFCLGTPETYDYIDQNLRLASCNVDYVNNPSRVAMHDNVISINNILEIDLLSQVCSESNGLRQISGTGDQLDFVLGAFESIGGKSFLAFSSTYTDKDGTLQSCIKPMLTPGAVVTVPRSSVHYLVTEYGKVKIKPLSIWGRAEALINLAHPDFRDDLIKSAQEMKIWSKTNRTAF